jgi:surface protein
MKTIKVQNKTIKSTIESLIEKYGNEVDLNHLDVQNVTNMLSMFEYSKFNGDISNWDVKNVTDMRGMFNRSKFNGDISNWNVKNVTDMKGMFNRSKFNGDISNWNVQNVTDMRWMFYHSKFNGDISNWNINGTKIHDIFRYDNWEVDIIKEFYNGIIPSSNILDVLRLDYPENFI